jgi:ABC-type microcin C transport system permease subunit YejE
MRTYLLLRLQFMLINTYMDLFNWIYVINYTKFEYFRPKYLFYGEKSSVMGNKDEFFNRIIVHMRAYLLLRLQFMLLNTYMDLFNWIYVINYTKFEYFRPKCPVYGEKSSFMGNKDEFFDRIIVYMRAYLLLRLRFMLINTYMD